MGRDQHPASSVCGNGFVTKNGYIVHHVSKLDTLAGVAIKYGVEVADIKRSNGLVTDLQMFAHKTLRIPVGRRHLFAPAFVKSEGSSLTGGVFPPKSTKSPSQSVQPDSVVQHDKRCRQNRPFSSAMNLLRGYYGLSSPSQQADRSHAGMEMTSPYKPDVEENSDDEPFLPVTMSFMASKVGHAKLNGIVNRQNCRDECQESLVPRTFSETSLTVTGESNSNERAVRRRFKTDVASTPPAIGCLESDGVNEVDVDRKQDSGSILDRVLPGAGLLGGPEDAGGLPVARLKVVDGAFVGSKGKDSLVLKVKKSSSTSSLQDQIGAQVNVGVQRFGPLAQGGPRTLFDMPPKPVNHRYKAALD